MVLTIKYILFLSVYHTMYSRYVVHQNDLSSLFYDCLYTSNVFEIISCWLTQRKLLKNRNKSVYGKCRKYIFFKNKHFTVSGLIILIFRKNMKIIRVFFWIDQKAYFLMKNWANIRSDPGKSVNLIIFS